MTGTRQAPSVPKDQLKRDIVSAVNYVTIQGLIEAFTGDSRIEYKVHILGRPVRIQNRGSGAAMGRFGGGWERNVGVQMSRAGLDGSIIINLWKGSIRIDAKETGA